MSTICLAICMDQSCYFLVPAWSLGERPQTASSSWAFLASQHFESLTNMDELNSSPAWSSSSLYSFPLHLQDWLQCYSTNEVREEATCLPSSLVRRQRRGGNKMNESSWVSSCSCSLDSKIQSVSPKVLICQSKCNKYPCCKFSTNNIPIACSSLNKHRLTFQLYGVFELLLT